MIKRYTDHSANERTYLAWVRTAITIMAFGFLIEKFELFLAYLAHQMGSPGEFTPSPAAELVGLALFLVGVLIVISATLRFFTYKRFIESDDDIPYGVRRTNMLLSTLMVALGIFLFAFVGFQLL